MSDELSDQHTIASNLKGASEPAEIPFQSRWATALTGDRTVLGELAADCWAPIYGWLRAYGSTPEEAARRMLEFPTWLQLHPPRPADEDYMRFSDYVLNRLGLYADARFPAVKPVIAVTIDQARAERKFADDGSRSPDEMFARRWAFMILEWTLSTLRAELDADGKVAQFSHLKGFLNFSGGTEERYAELGKEMGLTASALRVAVFRFRQRYRELLRHWISNTVRDAADVDGELTMLLCAAS
jgi:hypothetical protein